MKKKLIFKYSPVLNPEHVTIGLRVSMWSEKNIDYLTPIEILDSEVRLDEFVVLLRALDPNDYLTVDSIGSSFYFGHPGKIIGMGELIEIKDQTCESNRANH